MMQHFPCFFKIVANHRGTAAWIWGRNGPYMREGHTQFCLLGMAVFAM
jgi:hypothetical protein